MCFIYQFAALDSWNLSRQWFYSLVNTFTNETKRLCENIHYRLGDFVIYFTSCTHYNVIFFTLQVFS